MSASHEEIVSVYRAFYNRDPDPQTIAALQAIGLNLEGLLRHCLHPTATRADPEIPEYRKSKTYLEHNGPRFGVPRDLQVTPTPFKRVLLVGQCQLAPWPHMLKRHGILTPVDHVLLRPTEAPTPPHPVADYSFQVMTLGNRSLINDVEIFEWCRSRFGDAEFAEGLLSRAKGRMDRLLEVGTALRTEMPVFVTNVVRPQQDLNGRLIERSAGESIFALYDRLNIYLREAVGKLQNVYILDVIEIMATVGRKYVLDDAVEISTHAGVIHNAFLEEDAKRIEPPLKTTDYFDTKIDEYLLATWFEAEAMYRTLLQLDQVKMVCVDLDDTLWRGILAEQNIDDVDPYCAIEGWPGGLAEALAALRRRGILLCIISKNDESRVRTIFDKVYRKRLLLEDFAIVKINWRAKAENIRDAMSEAGLLPRSVMFLDDSPLERASVKQAFPDLRVVEAPLYYWRRILLWSAETQTTSITNESARRTEMVRAQVQREVLRENVSRDDFLRDLNLRVTLSRVSGQGARFARALELLNKSNQFNTNGQRWTAQQLAGAVETGLVVAAAVSDKFTDYGDTLIAIMLGSEIRQIVMSCRVIGLGVEIAVVSFLASKFRGCEPTLFSTIVETDVNILARDLFARCGWSCANGVWVGGSPGIPLHITLSNDL